jgi:protein SCO1/2
VKRAALFAAVILAGCAAARAGDNERPTILRDIGFDQKLGDRIPLDTPFHDEAGRAVRLADYFRGKPVVMNLVYFDCPMLCTVTLSGMASALKELSWDAGNEFEVITISFDPKEGPEQAAAKKKEFMARYKRPGAEKGWHFLTGDIGAIRRITQAVGFRYVWDQASQQFAHPAGTVILTPEGQISRYLFGVEYAPRDLRLALVESGGGKIGSPIDAVFLACYRYDPMTGRYSAAIMSIVRLAAIATVLALAAFIFVNWRREHARSTQRLAT